MAASLLAGCAGHSAEAPRHGAASPELSRSDILWLERTSFGINSVSVQSYRRLGRERFLEAQLLVRDPVLPALIGAQLAALEVAHTDPLQAIAAVNGERQRINAMSDEADKEQARKALNERGNRLANEAARRDLLRAVYSESQLQEQMVWFWLNHFSLYQYKAELRWLVGDYEERAIRPYALGHFRDLVLATLEHPAMLQYLDNRQNRAGHSNENYARELLELHTLGVDGGYTQQDVQQLALILTGVGINTEQAPRLRRELQGLYKRRGAFEFNPAHHDFSDKVLLGRTIHGSGFDEVEAAVTLIVHQRACAHFISGQMARYFVADNPPPALVERMTRTFLQTDGDIAAVLRTMFLAPEFDSAAGGKFKDPQRFVVSAVRFAYDGRTIGNTRPLLRWLNDLGEAPYGHQTPDGYALTEANWASAGQMSRRFEIARAIGSGNAGLFDPEDGGTATASGFPQLSNRLYFSTIEPLLSAQTRAALDQANSQQEWNLLLLSSPEFNYE
ncbi:MAG: DUF1800 domain-containing protein [Steroidobacterales bacterium]